LSESSSFQQINNYYFLFRCSSSSSSRKRGSAPWRLRFLRRSKWHHLFFSYFSRSSIIAYATGKK